MYCRFGYFINNKVNNNVKFKVDTGASTNIINVEQLKRIEFNLRNINKTNETLVTFTKQTIPIIGKCYLDLEFQGKC